MRRDGGMVKLVRDAAAKNIPMAAICHGPWMMCSTDVLRGKRCTSYMSIAHDVINAGGKWVDEEVVVDGNIITSRCPDDLPSFSMAILQFVSEGKATGVKGKPIAPAWLMRRSRPVHVGERRSIKSQVSSSGLTPMNRDAISRQRAATSADSIKTRSF
jgi:hypothetical protein